MGLEFVTQFFKLTLDNIYRFACALMFAVGLTGVNQQRSPLRQLSELLDWLAVPSDWLVPIGDWIALRQELVGAVAGLVLILAVISASANSWHTRAGSTVLAASAVLMEAGLGSQLLALVGSLSVMGVIVAIAAHVAERLHWDLGWYVTMRGKAANVLVAVLLACLSVASPIAWLLTEDPFNSRGSQLNPLYIEQVAPVGPSGARSGLVSSP